MLLIRFNNVVLFARIVVKELCSINVFEGLKIKYFSMSFML